MNRSVFAIPFIVALAWQCGEPSFESAEQLSSADYESLAVDPKSAEGFAAESLNTFMAFKGDLQKRLIGAIKEKGAPYAIQVCSVAAPEMEEKHSNDKQTIYRVSDRPRNPEHRANEFEDAVLKLWKSRMEAKKEIGPVHFRTKDAEYVMNPIPVQAALCLQCHGGAEIKPETRQAINELYPDDEATGYSVGDLRGAFVSKRSL